MRVVIRKSPMRDKKFRATVYDRGKVDVVDFGGVRPNGVPYSDYTKHKDPFIMRRYVGRHGGKVPVRLLSSTSRDEVQKRCFELRRAIRNPGVFEVFVPLGFGLVGFYGAFLTYETQHDSFKRHLEFLLRFSFS